MAALTLKAKPAAAVAEPEVSEGAAQRQAADVFVDLAKERKSPTYIYMYIYIYVRRIDPDIMFEKVSQREMSRNACALVNIHVETHIASYYTVTRMRYLPGVGGTFAVECAW